LVAGNVIFDTIARDARIGDLPLLMPRRESAILEHLMRRLGRVVPKETLEDKLYGWTTNLARMPFPCTSITCGVGSWMPAPRPKSIPFAASVIC
jgi:hypothetical protein